MGALPKHKVSRHQRGNRRREQVLKAPNLVVCPTCREMMMSHRVCRACGHYKGRAVVRVKGRDEEE